MTRDIWEALNHAKGNGDLLTSLILRWRMSRRMQWLLPLLLIVSPHQALKLASTVTMPMTSSPTTWICILCGKICHQHTDSHSIVAAASTEDNVNLGAFLSDNVFFVSQAKKQGHWLSQEELPSVVQAVIQVRSSGDACHDANHLTKVSENPKRHVKMKNLSGPKKRFHPQANCRLEM